MCVVFLVHGWTWIGFEGLLAFIRGGSVLRGVDFVDLVRHGGRLRVRHSGWVWFVVPHRWQSRRDSWVSRSQRVDSQCTGNS